MKSPGRILLHLSFWLVYFTVNLYNELYLSSSFTNHPSQDFFLDAVTAQLLVMFIKVPLVYYVLNALIPRWLNSPKRSYLFLEGFLALVLGLILYRIIIQYIVWPYVYQNDPVELTLLQYTARYFYSLLDLLQVIGVAASIKLFRLRLKAIEREKLLVQEKLKSEMLHLKSQINPHFLFNSLNSIYSLTRSGSSLAPEAVMRLSKILRYMLYGSGKNTISLDQEIQLIEDYIGLQQLRFGDKVEVKFEKYLDRPGVEVVPLLLIPLIENAFKHGVGTEKSLIEFIVLLKENKLHISCRNPIVEKVLPVEEEKGIGLENIRRQLELQYRDFDFNYGEENGQFIVSLDLNLSAYAAVELFDSRG